MDEEVYRFKYFYNTITLTAAVVTSHHVLCNMKSIPLVLPTKSNQNA
jgi:hypothetical protein